MAAEVGAREEPGQGWLVPQHRHGAQWEMTPEQNSLPNLG